MMMCLLRADSVVLRLRQATTGRYFAGVPVTDPWYPSALGKDGSLCLIDRDKAAINGTVPDTGMSGPGAKELRKTTSKRSRLCSESTLEWRNSLVWWFAPTDMRKSVLRETISQWTRQAPKPACQ